MVLDTGGELAATINRARNLLASRLDPRGPEPG
jgi:hypothetical protein